MAPIAASDMNADDGNRAGVPRPAASSAATSLGGNNRRSSVTRGSSTRANKRSTRPAVLRPDGLPLVSVRSPAVLPLCCRDFDRLRGLAPDLLAVGSASAPAVPTSLDAELEVFDAGGVSGAAVLAGVGSGVAVVVAAGVSACSWFWLVMLVILIMLCERRGPATEDRHLTPSSRREKRTSDDDDVVAAQNHAKIVDEVINSGKFGDLCAPAPSTGIFSLTRALHIAALPGG